MVKKYSNPYFIAAIAVIGGGLFGFDISSMSAIIAGESYRCYFDQSIDQSCMGPRPSVQGGIVASMAGGSWVASLFSGFLSDAIGRRRAVMLATIIWVMGCVVTSAAQNIPMLIVGRVLNGLCVGICSAQVPVYISEIAQPSKRGRLTGLQQWAITWGILIMFYISYGCSFLEGPKAFRIPWALQAIPAMILFVGMIFLPESPRWLALRGRWQECERVLILTHGHGDEYSPWVGRELQEIHEWVETENGSWRSGYQELLSPRYLNRTHIGLFTQIWSQLTGVNVMMYYITYVFKMAGVDKRHLLLTSSIQYVINVVMTIPALIWIDRIGRRPALLAGSTLMATFMFANAGIFAVYGVDTGPGGVDGYREASVTVSGNASKAVIACSYLFVASFAPTWGPVSWIYPPELYPNHLRGKAVALATSGNWIFNFALGYFVPPAFVDIKWRTYLVFATFCVVMTVHVFFLFPETAGRPLEHTNQMFEDPKGIKYLGTPAWRTKNYYSKSVRMEHGEEILEK
ncbi:high affinity glucose transporter [Extremus antarcticus]|uniref:High affinity glucose transporter n=1 Tax=Extremus antarcticus TaxID=702011 RepID=A0AAJ0DCY7_9PEZI|nr:high affinity glucose transporter [Extremus antarcticus]